MGDHREMDELYNFQFWLDYKAPAPTAFAGWGWPSPIGSRVRTFMRQGGLHLISDDGIHWPVCKQGYQPGHYYGMPDWYAYSGA